MFISMDLDKIFHNSYKGISSPFLHQQLATLGKYTQL